MVKRVKLCVIVLVELSTNTIRRKMSVPTEATSTNTSLTGSYTIDKSHSQIGFGARHAMVTKVRGQFNEFSETGFFDAENPSNSRLNVSIQVNSIDTHNTDRDNHLRGSDFLQSKSTQRLPSSQLLSRN